MESASQIIDRLAGIDVGVTCRKCGAVVAMVGRQYTNRCPACGTNITLTPSYLARLKLFEYRAKYGDLKEPPPKCGICRDTGAVILEEQEDDSLAKYVYRCLCQAGQKRKEDWPVVPAAKVVAFTPRLNLVHSD
jgi:predicted RNA-binding Zn-ribbon protein involved in translation (DUF1610 family)